MATLMENAQAIADGYNNYRDLIQQPENTDVVVPKGIIVISGLAFSFCKFRSIVLPETLTTIGNDAFSDSNFSNTSIPEGVTTIGRGAFQNCPFTSFTVPNGVTKIEANTFRGSKLVSINLPSNLYKFDTKPAGGRGGDAFNSCRDLESINIPDTCVFIAGSTFAGCDSLQTVHLPLSLHTLLDGAFYLCEALTTINIPASLTYLGDGIFMGCTALTNVTIENGFNCDGLNLSSSTLYSAETIVSWFNALYDRTGDTAYTLTIGSTNLAKLSAEQIAIATNKNWNLA